MLLEIFILFQIITIGFFIAAFFLKHEILWAITLVLTGIMMVTSWSVECSAYEYNNVTNAYDPVIISYNYPYLMGINMLFFIMALVLCIYDLFDKYGGRFAGKN